MPPKNIKELRQCLGVTGYYGQHIIHYSDITQHLGRLLHKDQSYIWTDQQQKSHEELKDACKIHPP